MPAARSEELDAPASPRAVRALVLVADVGHGHVAAGLAVAEDVRRLGGEADVRDGPNALGAVARHLIRDGYRVKLRVAPWTFDAMYGPGPSHSSAGTGGRARARRPRAPAAPAVVAPADRPPYGVLSAARVRHARSRGWEIVLWSRCGRDWRAAATPASVICQAAGG